MEAYQERMITERDKLTEKLWKLNNFIGGENFEKVDEQEQQRLLAQAHSMSLYLHILNERIKAFTNAR